MAILTLDWRNLKNRERKCHDKRARQGKAEHASWEGCDGILSTTPSKKQGKRRKGQDYCRKNAPNVTILVLVK